MQKKSGIYLQAWIFVIKWGFGGQKASEHVLWNAHILSKSLKHFGSTMSIWVIATLQPGAYCLSQSRAEPSSAGFFGSGTCLITSSCLWLWLLHANYGNATTLPWQPWWPSFESNPIAQDKTQEWWDCCVRSHIHILAVNSRLQMPTKL